MTTKKILVTGSAGFIGSHLVDYLISCGHKIYGIDDMSGGFKRNINSKSHFSKLDLRDREKTATYIKNIEPQIIYHLAADATEGRSQFTPLSCTDRNYVSYLNILVPAIKIKFEKIVLTSSMSVYGNQKPPFDETMPRKPVDIYGIAKTAMEEATEVMSKVFDFKYTIIRPHNVYGPRQNIADPYRNVVGIFINKMLNDEPFWIYGDGKQKRAFSYIDDLISPLAKAGFTADYETINLGGEKEYSINELAQIVLREFDKKNLTPIYYPGRPQEVKYAYCSFQKSKRLLDYETKTDLKEGVKKMIAWAKNLGFQKPRYLNSLEIVSKKTPKPWIV